MSPFAWFLASLLALGTLLNVSQVGKPRKPLDPTTAAFIVAMNAAVIAWLLVDQGVLG